MSPNQENAIAEFFDAVSRLEAAGVIRSARYLGDIGEFLCSDFLGTELVSGLRQRGHDGLSKGKKVQVKFNNSPKGNNINVGNPAEYDELVVVLGPRSKLREPEHESGEFRMYLFDSADVKPWGSAGGFYCAKARIANCRSKRVLKGRPNDGAV